MPQFKATDFADARPDGVSSPDVDGREDVISPPPTRIARRMSVLTACGALLVALIIGATAMFAFNMRAHALRDTGRELSNVDLILAEQTAQSFHALELVQSSVIEYMRAKKIDSTADLERLMGAPDVHRMLVDKISGLPQIDAITIINEHGKLINFSRYWPIPPVNVADRDYFKALKADGGRMIFLSEPVRNRGTGTWTIYLARKFTAPDGTFLGLVLGAIRLDYFYDYFGAITLGSGGSVSLLRRDGMLLARFPERPAAVGHIFPAVEAALKGSDRALMRRVSDIDHQERLVAARYVRDFPAIVTVSMSVPAATADAEHDALLLSGAGGALALSVGALVFLAARRSAAEQSQTQHALTRQQQKLDVALNNMSQGLTMFDPDGRLALCNERYSQIYRLPRDKATPGTDLRAQIEARKASGTWSGDTDKYCGEVIASVACGGAQRMIDLPDGRTILVINRPIAGGGWVATHEDITERRRTERERDRNRDFLDRVIENVPVMIIVKDARDLRYVLLNRASERRFGCPEGEAIGKSAHDVFPKERADELEAMERSILHSKQVKVLQEQEIELPGNGKRVQKTTLMPILGDDGEPLYLLIVAEDLTERKAMELQLQQAVKMEAVGNLTGGIAHDFNNLLMVMVGNLDLLVEEVADRLPAREKVETVLNAALHGAELTRQMLAFARRQPLNPKRVVIKDAIASTTRLLGRTLGDDIAIVPRIPDDLWPVRVDDSQLESSIVNIAINSRDAMPAGGTLMVEAENLAIDADAAARYGGVNRGDYVVIAVSDTGTGMPPELVARAFEPFVTTKARGKGSGLGLAMVYGFVKQSGGHVSIYSEVGRGTTLKLYLPRDVAPAEQPDVAVTGSPPLGGGETVLAVDDNKDVLKTVARQLADLGYNVVTTSSAFNALSMLDRGLAVDLLFSDVVMPGGMSGQELADEARRQHPDLKVLLTSGFTDAFLANKDPLQARYGLLSKPYRKHDLARAVRQALDRADR